MYKKMCLFFLTACPRHQRGHLQVLQAQQIGRFGFMHIIKNMSVLLVYSLFCPDKYLRQMFGICVLCCGRFNTCVCFCSKDVTPKDSPSGSLSETPKKSSKKSKKSKDNMTKVYTSVLDSVFGAVSI